MTRAPSHRPAEKWLTVPEVAESLRCSRMTVYRLIHEEGLHAIRVRGHFRVSERALDTFIRGADVSPWTSDEDGAA